MGFKHFKMKERGSPWLRGFLIAGLLSQTVVGFSATYTWIATNGTAWNGENWLIGGGGDQYYPIANDTAFFISEMAWPIINVSSEVGIITVKGVSPTISGANSLTFSNSNGSSSITVTGTSSSLTFSCPVILANDLTITEGSVLFENTIAGTAGSSQIEISEATMQVAYSNFSNLVFRVNSSGTLTFNGGGAVDFGLIQGPGQLLLQSGTYSPFISRCSIDAQVVNYDQFNIGSNAFTSSSYTQESQGVLAINLSGPGSITATAGLDLAGTLSLTGSNNGTVTLLSGNTRNGNFLPVSGVTYTPTAVVYNGASGCSGIWTSSSSTAWNNTANWSDSCVPGASTGNGHIAQIGTGSQTDIELGNFIPSLNVLQFESSSSFSVSESTIIFETFTNNPSLIVLAGTQTVNSNIAGSSSSTSFNVQIDDGATLNFGSLNQAPNMTNFQEVIFKEGTGLDQGLAFFNNYGTIGGGTASIETVTVEGGVLTNFENGSIVANALNITGGKVINSDQITVDSLTVGSGGAYQARMHSQDLFGVINANSINLNGHLIVQAMPGINLSSNQVFNLIEVSQAYSSKFNAVSFLDFPLTVVPEINYLSNSVELSIVQYVADPKATPAITPDMISNLSGQQSMFLTRKFAQLKDRMVEFTPSTSVSADYVLSDKDLMAQNTNVELIKQEQLSLRAKEGKKPGNFYIAPIGSITRVQSYKKMPAVNSGSVGFLTGFDYSLNTANQPFWLGLGTEFDYQYGLGTIHSNTGSFHSQKVHGSIYSAFVPKAVPGLDLNLSLGYGYSWDSITRIAGHKHVKTYGSTNESVFDLIFDVEYLLSKDTVQNFPKAFSLTPFGYIQYVNDQVGGYKEHGAGIYDLKYKSLTLQSAASTIGSRFNLIQEHKDVKMTLEMDVAWRYEFMNQNNKISYSTVSYVPYSNSVTIAAPGRNTALVSLDLFLQIFDKYLFEASCDTKWNAEYIQAFFYLGTGVQF